MHTGAPGAQETVKVIDNLKNSPMGVVIEFRALGSSETKGARVHWYLFPFQTASSTLVVFFLTPSLALTVSEGRGKPTCLVLLHLKYFIGDNPGWLSSNILGVALEPCKIWAKQELWTFNSSPCCLVFSRTSMTAILWMDLLGPRASMSMPSEVWSASETTMFWVNGMESWTTRM